MITVVTPDHGKIVFPYADWWETLDGRMGDEGNLSVGTVVGDDEVDAKAEFAKGSWLFVYFVEDEELPQGPGQLWQLPENPLDVSEWRPYVPAPDYSQVHDYVHQEEDETPVARVLDKLTLADLADGTVWGDCDGDHLALVEGGKVRRTYHRADGDTFEATDDEWIDDALTAYGPYTEVLDA